MRVHYGESRGCSDEQCPQCGDYGAGRLAKENERLRVLVERFRVICLQDALRDANLSDDFDDAMDAADTELDRVL